jgi:hypothetical protein
MKGEGMAQSKTSLLSSGKKADRESKSGSCLGRFNYSNGAGWRVKVNRKKANKGKGQTSGQTKGGTCQANAFMRYCATTSRSYKHHNYKRFIVMARSHDQARRY